MSLIADNDKHSNFYTGLSWQVVNHLFQFLSPVIHGSRALKKDEFFMVLVWLLLGLSLNDLAHRFDVCTSTMTKIFQIWLEVMYCHLQFLIKWPDRDVIRRNMPLAFKQLYALIVLKLS